MKDITDLYILAVVDDPLAERLLRRSLQRQGFQVSFVASEEGVFEFLENSSVDVVLIDTDIKEFSVFETIKIIKAVNYEENYFSIIIMSSNVFHYLDDEIISDHVDAFIEKPVDIHVLIDTVETLANNSRGVRSSKKNTN